MVKVETAGQATGDCKIKRTGVRGSLRSQVVVCTLSFDAQHNTKSVLCDVRRWRPKQTLVHFQ